MQSTLSHQLNIQRWFYIFIFTHVFCWTIVPILIRHNLPLDAIEGTIWGHQLEWGYDKNPYLNGWLTALAIYLGGPSGWMIYLFSQLSVLACFWSVWQLAKKMFSPVYALIAVLLLEGIQYYNFHAIDFNDNTLELGLWALTIYFFYQATVSGKNSSYLDWILAGLFAGLGLMAKYYTALLILSMFLFLIAQPSVRKKLSTLPPYLGLLIFLIVTLPHLVWLFYHQFITVTYVFARTSSTPDWTNHFYFPAQFAWQQFEALFPALVLFSVFLIGKNSVEKDNTPRLNQLNRAFLFYLGLGPFLLTLLLSLALGIKLRAGWGMPLLSLWGIILLSLLPPKITANKLLRFIGLVFVLMGILLIGYSLSLIYSTSPSSANFPGKAIANTVTKTWHEKYHQKLEYIAGSRWIGGNIEFYSPDHPAVFIEWNHAQSPWINLQDLKSKGGVFVWEISAHETLPKEIQKAFPKLENITVLQFTLERNQPHLPPIDIGLALLPPA